MDLTDEELWKQCQEGDATALGELFVRHKPAVYGLVLKLTGDLPLSEDITSAVFLTAWERRDASIRPGAMRSWLFGIAVNHVRTHRRSLRRYRKAVERIVPREELAGGDDEIAARLDDQSLCWEMSKRIADLRTEEKELVVLCWWTGLTYHEAAEVLAIPVGTVRSRLSRIRQQLRQHASILGVHGKDTP